MVAYTCDLAYRNQRQEGSKVETSLSPVAKACLKNKRSKNKSKNFMTSFSVALITL